MQIIYMSMVHKLLFQCLLLWSFWWTILNNSGFSLYKYVNYSPIQMCGSHLGGKNVHLPTYLYVLVSEVYKSFITFRFRHNLCLLIICRHLFLHWKYRLIAKHQSYTVSKLGNHDFQSYNNSDLNIARHLHQVHLKCQQEYSIAGRCCRIAKISACVNVFITIRMFSLSVWLLSLNLSVFKNVLLGSKWQYI